MLEIVMTPERIGSGVTTAGDIAITGVDSSVGMTITLVIDSKTWPEFQQKLRQLKGVGIYRANRIEA